jgi:hypothetical protein
VKEQQAAPAASVPQEVSPHAEISLSSEGLYFYGTGSTVESKMDTIIQCLNNILNRLDNIANLLANETEEGIVYRSFSEHQPNTILPMDVTTSDITLEQIRGLLNEETQ